MVDDIKISSYNQAGYQMLRLHEVWNRIDRLSINMFVWNEDFQGWNFRVIFNDLSTLYLSASSKLKPEEVDSVERVRKLIRQVMRNNPISSVNNIAGFNSHKVSVPNYENQDKIEDLLLYYRHLVEVVLDKHGLGNPDKKDPGKAIIQT